MGSHDDGAGLNLLGIGDDCRGRTRGDRDDHNRVQLGVCIREQCIEPLAGFALGPPRQFRDAREASLRSGTKCEGIVKHVDEMQPGTECPRQLPGIRESVVGRRFEIVWDDENL